MRWTSLGMVVLLTGFVAASTVSTAPLEHSDSDGFLASLALSS